MLERNLRQVDILECVKPFCKKYDVKMNKSDLSQYVSGKVEPSQEKLVVLGMALNVNEAWLMGFDVPMERHEKNNGETYKIIQSYNQLNDIGKHEAIKRIEELTQIEKYTILNHLLPNAAHERTDMEATEEMRQHDEDIMDDENF